MIRALLFLATLGIAFAAKCASIDNPKLHATFPSATSYPCFTPFVHTNGKCDAGFVEGKHGAPQMKCCGGNWSDSGSKYACVPAGPPPPSPPSPGPAPPSPGPAPPSPGPAPPSPGPAPPSPGPAPPSPSPPPPSPPTPPPPGKFNNYGFLSAGNTTCKGISWGGIVVTMGNATLLNSTANATISSVDASGCSTFVTVPPISQRIGNGTNVTHHAVNNAGFELKFVDESTATFHFQQDAIYHCQDYTTTPPTGCKYVSGSKSVNLLAVYVETTVGKANINATQPKFTSIGASKAYDCDGPVEFVDAKTNATVTFTGLELEAFVDEATESFAPIDAANSYCPATSNTKANKAGIIVGGIIAGLAAIGIIFFAYSKCSGSSGYQNLDKV